MGLVCCRPKIHLAKVARSPAPAMHMAKTGPSSTAGDRTERTEAASILATPQHFAYSAMESSSESRVTGNQDSWGPNLTSTPPSTRKLSIHRTTIILHPQGGGGFSVKDAKSTHPGTNFFHPALKCGHFWGRTQQLQHSHLEQKSLFYPAAEEFRFKRVQVGKKSIC